MRLIKMFCLAALAAVAAMAFVGVTPSSAETPTQVCKEHIELECAEGQGALLLHQELQAGTVAKLLTSLVTILCLNGLVHAEILQLGSPQSIHSSITMSGCGTGSAHNNCTVTIEEQPLADLLKFGLDVGSLTFTSGRARLVCSNLGLDCKYDLEGTLFLAGSQHLTVNETAVTELGGKFFCPDQAKLDGLLKSTEELYVLQ